MSLFIGLLYACSAAALVAIVTWLFFRRIPILAASFIIGAACTVLIMVCWRAADYGFVRGQPNALAYLMMVAPCHAWRIGLLPSLMLAYVAQGLVMTALGSSVWLAIRRNAA